MAGNAPKGFLLPLFLYATKWEWTVYMCLFQIFWVHVSAENQQNRSKSDLEEG